MLDEGLWQTDGKTPAATVSAGLYMDIKSKGAGSRFVQVGKNTFGFRPHPQRLSFTDAAEDVLQRHGNGHPMHYRDITKMVLDEGLVKTTGKTPEATLYAQVITENARAAREDKPLTWLINGEQLVKLLVANDIGARRVAIDLVEPTGFDLNAPGDD